MKRKILIGYDESGCADAALDDLQIAGLPSDTEAFVMAVAEVWLPPPPPSAYEIVEEAREVKVPSDLKRVYSRTCAAAQRALAAAETARQRLQAKFPGWRVSAGSACGAPAWELIHKADEWQPDLIVVGSHGRSAINRLMLGSVSQRVLAEANCSVRIARGGVNEPDKPVRILVGIDGSPASETAVEEVGRREWPSNTEILLVMVDDPLTPTFFGKLIPPIAEVVEESNREDRLWVANELNKCAAILNTKGLKVSTTIREGEPKRVLVQLADEWRADCIFLGAIGFSNRLERFVLGSVSAAVAARAHCTVEAVRRPGD